MSLVAVSCSPAYGGVVIHEANTGQVIATGAPQKLTVWASAFPEAGGVDGQVLNDRIVIARAGVYLTAWHMSFITSGPARWVGHVYLNGASCCLDWDRNVSGPGGPGSVSCAGPLTIPAGGIIEAYLSHDKPGDITCTPANSQLYVVRVG